MPGPRTATCFTCSLLLPAPFPTAPSQPPQTPCTMFVPTCHRHAWSSDFGRMNYGALPEPYRSEMVQLRIAEVVAENPDPKNQYPLVRGEGAEEGQVKGRG